MDALLLRDTPTRVRFSVDDYRRLDAAGVLDGFGRTELIDGDILTINAMHRPHSRRGGGWRG